MSYSGGYLLLKEAIVRGHGPNAHTANDLSQLSDYTVDALNHIQETPWAINKFVYGVVDQLSKLGADVGITKKGGFEPILILERPTPPHLDPLSVVNLRFPASVWEGMDRAQRNQTNAQKARVMVKFEEESAVYRATQRILMEAEEMSQFEKFYYPHNMDFRTRIYPIPTDLTPQSNDLSKGLLRFFRGTRLGKEGLFWMGVAVASLFGEDKLSPHEQFEFANRLLIEQGVADWVDDPVANRGWLFADSPFQFLAVLHEWVWANRLEDPESFVSFLPGSRDGSCNGAQHLSIMARDMVGAVATNCTASTTREDLYLEVADRVHERIAQDAAAGLSVATEWIVKMSDKAERRNVVKRSVMTVPYGVTKFGVADFMVKDKHVPEKADSEWDSAKYMRDLIMDSIDSTLSNGRALQRWFQACSVLCAENGLSLVWDTPAGSKVTQAYRNVVMKRIKTLNTRFVVYSEPTEGEEDYEYYDRLGMNIAKMGTSAPPNVVHSCDASHLQITVCRMAEAGIKDFSMIHDSFGCPFAQIGLMNKILRQSIVDMYEDDYLEKWKESVERYSGLKMPDAPPRGKFDIQEILESEYFFS